MSTLTSTLNYNPNPTSSIIVKVLKDYVSSVSGNHLTELLIVIPNKKKQTMQLCVHYWCNGNEFAVDNIATIPYTLSKKEILSYYRNEVVVDYV